MFVYKEYKAMIEITSASNNKCKYVKALAQKKARQKYGEYIIEGIKSVSDAIEARKKITGLYISDTFFVNEKYPYPSDVSVYKLPDSIFEKICDTKTPQGILAVVKAEDIKDFVPSLSESYVYCDCVNDPGNLGTIIRTADAAGFGGVLLSDGCADPYSPKVVRSSMGSFFHIKIVTDFSYKALEECKKNGFSLFAGALDNKAVDYRKADMTKPSIIAVGNEANGICDTVKTMCQCVKIPIVGKAESLNVGVAAALLMYELVRQRS